MEHIIGIDIRGLSHNPFFEALAIFTFSVIARTHAELGEQVIEMASQPVSFSIPLAGAGSATALVPPPGKIGFAYILL